MKGEELLSYDYDDCLSSQTSAYWVKLMAEPSAANND